MSQPFLLRSSKLQADRDGLSLVEVLVSIAIAVTGFVSIAALIAAGASRVQKANTNNGASAFVRNAWRDAQARGILSEERIMMLGQRRYLDNTASIQGPTQCWHPIALAYPLLAPVYNANFGDPVLSEYTYAHGDFVVDPLFISASFDATDAQARSYFPVRYAGNEPALPRATVAKVVNGDGQLSPLISDVNAPLQPSQTEYIPHFNNLSFAIAADIFQPANVGGFDSSEVDRATSRSLREWDKTHSRWGENRNLSWFMTVHPDIKSKSAKIAIAVCNDRKLYEGATVPGAAAAFREASELSVPVTFTTWVQNTTSTDTPNRSAPGGGYVEIVTNLNAKLYPEIKAGNWILLYTMVDSRSNLSKYVVDSQNSTSKRVAQWYQVSGVRKVNNGDIVNLEITLSGPDWEYLKPTTPGDPTSAPVQVYAALIENVVAVHFKTVSLESLSHH